LELIFADQGLHIAELSDFILKNLAGRMINLIVLEPVTLFIARD